MSKTIKKRELNHISSRVIKVFKVDNIWTSKQIPIVFKMYSTCHRLSSPRSAAAQGHWPSQGGADALTGPTVWQM